MSIGVFAVFHRYLNHLVCVRNSFLRAFGRWSSLDVFDDFLVFLCKNILCLASNRIYKTSHWPTHSPIYLLLTIYYLLTYCHVHHICKSCSSYPPYSQLLLPLEKLGLKLDLCIVNFEIAAQPLLSNM